MNYRPFGTKGLKISEAGEGGSRLRGTVERRDDREVLAPPGEAMASGIDWFETAGMQVLCTPPPGGEELERMDRTGKSLC
jgi:predicted aldo/keto reductase-like oxidoreductase